MALEAPEVKKMVQIGYVCMGKYPPFGQGSGLLQIMALVRGFINNLLEMEPIYMQQQLKS